MPKTVTVGKDWVLLSDLVPSSNPNEKNKEKISLIYFCNIQSDYKEVKALDFK